MTSGIYDWIARENIERFRHLIGRAECAEERARLQQLIEPETAKLERGACPAAGDGDDRA